MFTIYMWWAWPACSQILVLWGANFTKMGDSLPWTLMNRYAKSNAVSFILGKEIRNHTNKQTKKHTNNKCYIHTLPIGM